MALLKRLTQEQEVYHYAGEEPSLRLGKIAAYPPLHVGTTVEAAHDRDSFGPPLGRNPEFWDRPPGVIYRLVIQPRKPLIARFPQGGFVMHEDAHLTEKPYPGYPGDWKKWRASRRPLVQYRAKIRKKYGSDEWGADERLRPLLDFGDEGVRRKQEDYRRRLTERLVRRGFDTIPYVNAVEDPGHISYAILDPKIIKSIEIITSSRNLRRKYFDMQRRIEAEGEAYEKKLYQTKLVKKAVKKAMKKLYPSGIK